ncbi:unnamed protein product [Prunus armeniaca]
MRNWVGKRKVELPKSKGTQNWTFGNEKLHCSFGNYIAVNKGQRSWSLADSDRPAMGGGGGRWPAVVTGTGIGIPTVVTGIGIGIPAVGFRQWWPAAGFRRWWLARYRHVA